MKKLTLLLMLFALWSGAAWAQDLGITAGQMFTIKSADTNPYRGYVVYSQATDYAYDEAPTLAGATYPQTINNFPSSIDVEGVYEEWTFIEDVSGNKYLYNVEKRAFLSPIGNFMKFCVNPQALEFVNLGNSKWAVKIGERYLSAAPGYGAAQKHKQTVIADQGSGDRGTHFYIEVIKDDNNEPRTVDATVRAEMKTKLDNRLAAGIKFSIKCTDTSTDRGYVVYSQATGYEVDNRPTLACPYTDNGASFPADTAVAGVHEEWAFIKDEEGNLYLYNVQKEEFIIPNGDVVDFCAHYPPTVTLQVHGTNGTTLMEKYSVRLETGDETGKYLEAGPWHGLHAAVRVANDANKAERQFYLEVMTDEAGNACKVDEALQTRMQDKLKDEIADGVKFRIRSTTDDTGTHGRGYVVYSTAPARGQTYTNRPILAAVTYPGYADKFPSSLTPDGNDNVYEDWAFITDSEGNRYIYNVEKKAFLTQGTEGTEPPAEFSDLKPKAVTLEGHDDGTGKDKLALKFEDGGYLGAAPGHGHTNGVIALNSISNDCNLFYLEVVKDENGTDVAVSTDVASIMKKKLDFDIAEGAMFLIKCADTQNGRGQIAYSRATGFEYEEGPTLAGVTYPQTKDQFPSATDDDSGVYSKWAFVTYEDNKYLYNVEKKEFMGCAGAEINDKPVKFCDLYPAIFDFEFLKDTNGELVFKVIVGGGYICAAPGVYGDDKLRNAVRAQGRKDDDGQSFFLIPTEGTVSQEVAAEMAKKANTEYADLVTTLEEAQALRGQIGNEVGHMTVNDDADGTAVADLEGAITDASNNIATTTDYVSYKTTLDNAMTTITNKGMTVKQPDANTYYHIVSASTLDYCQGKYVYVADNGGMFFEDKSEASPLKYVFRFEQNENGGMYMYNIERGVYANNFPTGDYAFAKGLDMSAAKQVTIANMGKGNIVSIQPSEQEMMHAREYDSSIVGYNDTDNTSASAWKIEEVKDITDLSHSVTIGSAGWSTLYLGYDATIPNDVTAYIVSETTDSKAMLTEVEGVIPANTAVMLQGEAKTYNFAVADASATVADDLVNALEGTGITINVKPADGATPYVLSKLDGIVGFYEATLNKTDSDGIANAAFQNNAFKAYLPVSATPLTARVLIFNFGDGTETGIEAVEGSDPSNGATIYDLSGRRVQNVQKGIYILNGKKVIK